MIKNANEIKSIEIYHRGAIKVIDLSIFRIDENDMITISMNIEGENYSYTSNNYFDAFCDARNDQEKNDITFCCNGARMNVYPSRMSLQMSLGRKAYEFELAGNWGNGSNGTEKSDKSAKYETCFVTIIGTYGSMAPDTSECRFGFISGLTRYFE